MWQMGRGSKEYRFQTSDRNAKNKMMRRKNFRLVGSGMNYDLWIFQARISRLDIAKKNLKTLTGEQVDFLSSEDIFISEGKSSSIPKMVA